MVVALALVRTANLPRVADRSVRFQRASVHFACWVNFTYDID